MRRGGDSFYNFDISQSYSYFNFLDGPRVIAQPESTSGNEGDVVTLHCDVDSNPSPKYRWTKDYDHKVSVLS